MALADHLIDGYLGTLPSSRAPRQDALYGCLIQGGLPGLVAAIHRLFAGIPWRNFTQNDLPDAEGYYASVLYAFFVSLNADIIPEDIGNQGQVDLTLKLEGFIYVIEIKLQRGQTPARPVTPLDPLSDDAASPLRLQSGANPALDQIRARDYSAKYRGLPNQGLFEVGLVFERQARNLVQADWRVVGA